MCFPSDCFGQHCREGAFDVRDSAEYDSRERTCAELAAGWKQLKCEWPNDNKFSVARWVPGCVVRVAIGGVGGRRILCMAPGPALRSAWADMVCDH